MELWTTTLYKILYRKIFFLASFDSYACLYTVVYMETGYEINQRSLGRYLVEFEDMDNIIWLIP